MPNKLVSVVIVTTGKNDYLGILLSSIKEQSYSDIEIIVIDNSVNQNFSKEIGKCYPDTKLCSSDRNLFYCEALNKGIEISKGEFILCLNDDVILDRKFIEEALRGVLVDIKIGMVSGKILRSDGKTLDSTGLFLSPWRSAKERGYGIKDMGQFNKEEYVFGVNGAVAFYRREMLEQIKIGEEYFDEDYRIFYEDLDIAWRAQNYGWKAYYMPKAIAYHTRGGTVRGQAGQDKPYARRFLKSDLHLDLVKNRYLTIIKNESFRNFLLHMPLILCYDFLAWGYILFLKPILIKKFFLTFPQYLNSAFIKRIKLLRLLHYKYLKKSTEACGDVWEKFQY